MTPGPVLDSYFKKVNKFSSDLTPNNVLQSISSLHGLSEDETLKALGEPTKVALLTESGEPHTLLGTHCQIRLAKNNEPTVYQLR